MKQSTLKIKDQKKFREALKKVVYVSTCPGIHDLEETDNCSIDECFDCWLNAIGVEEARNG